MTTAAVFDDTTDHGIYEGTNTPEPTRHIVAGQGIYTPEGLEEGDVIDDAGNLLQRDGVELSQQAAAAEGAPEAYSDFTLAEGLEVNETELGQFHEVARELGLSQAQAQKLVDLEAKRVQAMGETITEALEGAVDQQATAWEEASRADSEIGGADFESNVTAARGVVQQFGDAELKELLSSGLGNCPPLVRFCLRVARALEGRQEVSETGVYG